MQLEQSASSLAPRTRRTAYALAAGAAAAVSTNSAEAAVIYSGSQNISIGQTFSQSLNLDNDGFQDITLKNFVFSNGNYQGATVDWGPGKLVGFGASFPFYVTALTAGTLIDSAAMGQSFYGSMALGAANPNAQFNDVDNAFVGFSFPAAGNLYYAWVRVDVDNAAGTFVIKDWAYENQPGVGIVAGDGIVPEPATLGLMACGAAGLVALRRQRARAN